MDMWVKHNIGTKKCVEVLGTGRIAQVVRRSLLVQEVWTKPRKWAPLTR